MPEHQTYIEPFVGGGSVLLAKPPANAEIAADLDAGLVGMWQCLADREKSSWVRWQCDTTPYLEREFHRACDDADYYPLGCPSQAVTYLVRSRFSRGGLGKTFAWSDRLRGGQPGDANAWDTFRKVDLPAICERVEGVEFYCRNALSVVGEWAGNDDALLYLDPPYHHATRTAKSAYEHEMSDGDHRALLGLITDPETTARVMLSGYRYDLYDDALSGWRRVDFDMPNHSSQAKTKQRRTESLWLNF